MTKDNNKYSIGDCVVFVGSSSLESQLKRGTNGIVTEVLEGLGEMIFAAVVDFDCEEGDNWPMLSDEIQHVEQEQQHYASTAV